MLLICRVVAGGRGRYAKWPYDARPNRRALGQADKKEVASIGQAGNIPL
ncbi:MAG: hypothetical protein QF721_00430 [Verrucomicrobiota bacterium]|nr:hypothetical protein [Verrucomicrobiota bacterium]MDP7047893.1 hypothetical protein [Verrucomicrobiota bacterium]